MPNDGRKPKSTRDSLWGSTHWSIVLEAGDTTSPHARAARESLCRAYWFPIYAFVRRRGHSAEAAEDLTQAFFADLLARQAIGRVDPAYGRFRSFLLACLKNFLANESDKWHSQKRGGHLTIVPIDAQLADQQYSFEPTHSMTAEKIFQREWSARLLEQVLHGLAEESERQGEQLQFDALREFIAGTSGRTYIAVARELGITESAAMTKVHRLRKRFAKALRIEIGRTLTSPNEIEEELQAMIQCWS